MLVTQAHAVLLLQTPGCEDNRMWMQGGKRKPGPEEAGASGSGRVRNETAPGKVKTTQENEVLNVPDLAATADDFRPYVRVKIQSRSFIGLLDTGAVASVIGNEVARYLEDEGFRADNKATIARMADGTTSEFKGRFRFRCKIGEYPTVMTARYLPTLAASVIVGMDVIRELDLIKFRPGINEWFEGAKDSSGLAVVTELTELQKRTLSNFLEDEFEKFEDVSGKTSLIEHEIRIKATDPIKQRYYPRNPYMQQKVNDEVDEMLADGVIEPSSSPWSSPIVLVKKASGGLRFCVDFRKVNEASEKDAYPLPRIDAILDKLREAKYISTLDLKSGYWQVPLKPESRPVTAFTVPGKGLFQFRVMPFGLHSAGATFQRLVDRIIGPELEPRVFAYLDDLVVIGKTFEEHLELLKEVFQRLRTANLRLNIEKCHFCKKELRYLGHLINEDGIQTDPEKVRAIVEFPEPRTIKSLRSFLGVASWYRRFVNNFAKISAPLTRLLRKDAKWSWGKEQQSAFDSLKDCLTKAPALACPSAYLFHSRLTHREKDWGRLLLKPWMEKRPLSRTPVDYFRTEKSVFPSRS